MPHELRRDGSLAFTRFYGRVAGRELQDNIEELTAHDRFDDLRYCIVDLSEVAGADACIPDLDLAQAAMIGSTYSNPRLLIAVVSPDGKLPHVAEVFLAIGNPRDQPQVFPTVAQAVDWIASHTGSHEPRQLGQLSGLAG